MATLVELRHATRQQRRITESYLSVIAKKTDVDSHYRIVTNPLITAAVEIPTNPPSKTAASDFYDCLADSAAYDLIKIKRDYVKFVARPNATDMINATHMDPETLPQALQQELLHTLDGNEHSEHQDAHDPRAYAHLPQIIKDHWGHFNNDIKTHAIRCMAMHLTQPSTWPYAHKPNPHQHFSSHIICDFPYIPVSLDDMPPQDLMTLLVSVASNRATLSRIQPAKETEALRLRATHKPSLTR